MDIRGIAVKVMLVLAAFGGPARAQADAPGAPWPHVAAASAGISQRAMDYYARRFGVEDLRVRRVSSGSMLEFRYLVTDVQKAKVLNDKKAPPLMTDEKTGIKVGVPFMENIGTLRQSAAPKQDREYWMVFENPGRTIRRGAKVDITIGSFHVAGLIVE